MRKLSLVNETLRPETETFDFQSETRPRRWENASRDRLETETSRPRLHPCISVPLTLLALVRVLFLFYRVHVLSVTIAATHFTVNEVAALEPTTLSLCLICYTVEH